ncbi:MAG: carboxypeptidase regulatory-like domain-containing protein [bacterium]
MHRASRIRTLLVFLLVSGIVLLGCAPSVSVRASTFSTSSPFALKGANYTISGHVVTYDSGAGLPGVTVSVAGSTAVTDASGLYVLTGLTAGSYTVTPSLTGQYFAPANRSVTITDTSQGGSDFSVAAPKYGISGLTTDENGNPLGGVQIKDLISGRILDTSGSSGSYFFLGTTGATYNLQAIKSQRTFLPPTKSFQVMAATGGRSDINFATDPHSAAAILSLKTYQGSTNTTEYVGKPANERVETIPRGDAKQFEWSVRYPATVSCNFYYINADSVLARATIGEVTRIASTLRNSQYGPWIVDILNNIPQIPSSLANGDPAALNQWIQGAVSHAIVTNLPSSYDQAMVARAIEILQPNVITQDCSAFKANKVRIRNSTMVIGNYFTGDPLFKAIDGMYALVLTSKLDGKVVDSQYLSIRTAAATPSPVASVHGTAVDGHSAMLPVRSDNPFIITLWKLDPGTGRRTGARKQLGYIAGGAGQFAGETEPGRYDIEVTTPTAPPVIWLSNKTLGGGTNELGTYTAADSFSAVTQN